MIVEKQQQILSSITYANKQDNVYDAIETYPVLILDMGKLKMDKTSSHSVPSGFSFPLFIIERIDNQASLSAARQKVESDMITVLGQITATSEEIEVYETVIDGNQCCVAETTINVRR